MRGGTNKEIAARLGLREQTVKNHLSRVYRKVGVRNRVELAVYGFTHLSGEG
jgi:DNA-binding NarL/FixJ family response regulator